MFVVTGKEMATIDQLAIEEWGIPELVLMENAGLKVVEEIKKRFKKIQGKKITIIAGKGNNGGDGLVIARHLCNLGADVKIFLLGSKEYKGAALVNFNIAKKLPVKWEKIENENNLHLLKLTLHYTDILIDAMFGTGLKGNVKEMAAKVIEIVNDSKCFKIAVDVPSGLDSDTGRILGNCIKADLTICFALPKLGLIIPPGIDYTGELQVVDISIPPVLIEDLGIDRQLVTKSLIKNFIPFRKKEGHKGNYGHVLVIGGSLGMMGAVNLAVKGAFALGAGLVSAVIPRSIQPALASTLPELITVPVSETPQGTLGFISGPEIQNCLEGKSAVIFGPGMGRHSEIQSLLRWLLTQINVPLVIDADGLNALAQDLEILREAKCPVILTPHHGEMARLLKVSNEEIQKNRIDYALKLAKDYGVWVVLKGYKTIIASPKGEIYLNPTGSPTLSTAGTGDVLAGMTGGILGQITNITMAICTAVYIHGLAGEIVGEEIGEISSMASDVLKSIPKILKREFN